MAINEILEKFEPKPENLFDDLAGRSKGQTDASHHTSGHLCNRHERRQAQNRRAGYTPKLAAVNDLMNS
ncbi:MAG: hypothetical protein DRQ10_01710 [Candidatus Hydrothermota bacterium]|nr:MAG: hypothetical protein DRQ10_01710 [Candidatus Hydrothermae bacterium]